MRGLTRRWILPDAAAERGGASGLEPLVEKILRARGLADPETIEAFLNPRLAALHDPSLLADMDRACRRALDALARGEQIVIYGDYDVDGVTAAAILFHTLRAIDPDARVSIYIPHRLDEGYGLSGEAIRDLAAQGARVVVSVDCGVTAVEPARAAREAGVDLIITDHHIPPASGETPDAFAVIHPRRPGGKYPFGDLSGAGVAFKMAWRLATMSCGGDRVPAPVRETLLDMLALAALGTIADVVPLVDENRLIARFGLSRLPASPLPGVQALIRAAGLGGERMNAEHVGFVLGPRLNACGRMGHAREAAELLTTAGPERAETLAVELTRMNDHRRATERAILEEAMRMAEAAGMTRDDRRAIVLAQEGWHPGVVGIVCSRLVERFGRPTILMSREGDLCRGSGRSVEGFDMHAALARCGERLTSFGGHAMAAGLALETSHLDAFTESFTEVANGALEVEDLAAAVPVDCETTLEELSPPAVRRLERLGPFGRGNPTPRVLLRDLTVIRDGETFGARGAHLGVQVRAEGRIVRLVGWNWGEHKSRFRQGTTLDAVVKPKVNEWNGRVRVEPHIEDIAPAGAAETAARPGAALSAPSPSPS